MSILESLQSARSSFNILDYANQLEESEKKGRYICPACGGSNLTISQNGAYQCWGDDSDAHRAEIREALAPRGNRAPTAPKAPAQRAKKVAVRKPAPVSEELLALPVATLPSLPPTANMPERTTGQGFKKTYYYYSESKKIKRVDTVGEDGRWIKDIRPSYRDANGDWHKGKGKEAWPPYQIEEALQCGNGKWLHGFEGEECVEAARGKGIVAITFSGSDWKPEILNTTFLELKNAGIAGFAYHPDNDLPGQKKALLIEQACANVQLPCVIVPPKILWVNDDIPDKADIKDWLETIAMGEEEIINHLHDCLALSMQAAFEKEDESSDELSIESGKDDDNWVDDTFTIEAHILDTLFEGGEGDWCTIDDSFYKYKKGYWKLISEKDIQLKVALALKQSYKIVTVREGGFEKVYCFFSEVKKQSTFKICRDALHIPEHERTYNNHLLCFNNCTVDVRTAKALPHNPKHFLTRAIASDYEPNQPCPEVFLNFIKQAFGEDLLLPIRAYFSMLLDPTAAYGKFIHLIGPSGSGKGTFLRLVGEMFGIDHFRSGDFSNLSTPEGRHQHLTNVGLFAVPDCGGYLQGLKAFFELVDNGPMSGRALFSSNGYQKKFDTRFIIASVDHLQIENSGDGWDRRCLPLPTKAREGIENFSLGTQLAEVKGQIISWALAMDKRERDMLVLCPPTNERVAELKRDASMSGDPVRHFVDLCLRPTVDDVNTSSAELHSKYRAYTGEHGYQSCGMSKFINHLKTIIPQHYVPRQKTNRNKWIPAHWKEVIFVPEAFENMASANQGNEDRNYADHFEQDLEPNWRCKKSKCQEGGLDEFAAWSGTPGTPTGTPTQKVGVPPTAQGLQPENLLTGTPTLDETSNVGVPPTAQGSQTKSTPSTSGGGVKLYARQCELWAAAKKELDAAGVMQIDDEKVETTPPLAVPGVPEAETLTQQVVHPLLEVGVPVGVPEVAQSLSGQVVHPLLEAVTEMGVPVIETPATLVTEVNATLVELLADTSEKLILQCLREGEGSHSDAAITDAAQKLPTEHQENILQWLSELQSEINVGDRVQWDDCPPHCAFMNPFVVIGIEGEMAELGFYNKPVPLAQLRRVSAL